MGVSNSKVQQEVDGPTTSLAEVIFEVRHLALVRCVSFSAPTNRLTDPSKKKKCPFSEGETRTSSPPHSRDGSNGRRRSGGAQEGVGEGTDASPHPSTRDTDCSGELVHRACEKMSGWNGRENSAGWRCVRQSSGPGHQKKRTSRQLQRHMWNV